MAKLNKLHPDGTKELKDFGSQVRCILWNEDGTYKEDVKGGVPTIGGSMHVGTLNHWWLTTPITEIIELKRNKENKIEYCYFKTKNSRYELIG